MIRRLLCALVALLFPLCLLGPVLLPAQQAPAPGPAAVVEVSPAPTPAPSRPSAAARASRSRPVTPTPPAAPTDMGMTGVALAATSKPTPIPVGKTHRRSKRTGIAGIVGDCESGARRADGTAVPGSRQYHLIHYPSGLSSASGAYGFLDGTWTDVTGRTDRAYQAPPAVQDAAFAKLYASAGLTPWHASRSCWNRR